MRYSMSSRFFTVLLTACAPALWGTTYVVTTQLLPPSHPLLAAATRSLPVGLLLLCVVRRLPQGSWWWKAMVLGVLNFGAFFALLFVTAYRLPGGVASLVGALQPLIVALLAWLLLRTPPLPRQLWASLLGIIGVGLLVLRAEARLDTLGLITATLGTTSMALGTVLTKKWGRPVSLLAFTSWQLIVGGLILAPLALFVEGLPHTLTFTNMLGFAYLDLLGTGLAYALWFRGIERLTVSSVTLLSLLSSIVATIAGYVFLHQTLTVLQVVGAVLIVIGIVIGQLFPTRAQQTEEKTRLGRQLEGEEAAEGRLPAFDKKS